MKGACVGGWGNAGLLAPLAAGAAVIVPEEGRFSASTFWRDAVAHQATFYTAVPTMHQVRCRHPASLPGSQPNEAVFPREI